MNFTGRPLNVLNESTSISSSSIEKLTYDLKRTSSDETLVSDKIKKSKITVNEHLMAGSEGRLSHDNNFEVFGLDSISDNATKQNVEVVRDEKETQNVLNGISQKTDDDNPHLLKCFNENHMTFAVRNFLYVICH
jgi:hypothetical protein